MGENKICGAFDKIHAEKELKEDTKKFLEGYYEKEKKSWNFSFYKVVIPVLTVLVIIISGVTVRSQTVEAARIELKNGPEISLSINRWNKVIQVEGLSEEAKQLIEDLDLEGMTYLDAVEKILEDETYWQDTAAAEAIEVEVTCGSDQLCEEIKEEVTTQCQKYQYGKHSEEGSNQDNNGTEDTKVEQGQNQEQECLQNQQNEQEESHQGQHEGNGQQGQHNGTGKQKNKNLTE